MTHIRWADLGWAQLLALYALHPVTTFREHRDFRRRRQEYYANLTSDFKKNLREDLSAIAEMTKQGAGHDKSTDELWQKMVDSLGTEPVRSTWTPVSAAVAQSTKKLDQEAAHRAFTSALQKAAKVLPRFEYFSVTAVGGLLKDGHIPGVMAYHTTAATIVIGITRSSATEYVVIVDPRFG
jgi:hypothetical protein